MLRTKIERKAGAALSDLKIAAGRWLVLGLALAVMSACAAPRSEQDMDPASFARLESMLKADFPEVYEIFRANMAAGKEEDMRRAEDAVSVAMQPYIAQAYKAPDQDIFEYILAAKEWSDPDKGRFNCPNSKDFWQTPLAWESLEAAAAARRAPITRAPPSGRDIDLLDAQFPKIQDQRAMWEVRTRQEPSLRPKERCRLMHRWFDALSKLPKDSAARLFADREGRSV